MVFKGIAKNVRKKEIGNMMQNIVKKLINMPENKELEVKTIYHI